MPVLYSQMALIGRLHPLLIHFPIGLVITAVAAESAEMMTSNRLWRIVAVANVRAGALFALVAAVAGWRMAVQLGIEETPLLEWHRWCGTLAAGLTLAAALATFVRAERSWVAASCYRVALFGAGALVAVAAHFGGLLVWGAELLHQ